MNVWSRILDLVARLQPSADRVYVPIVTKSGVPVNEDLALTYATVWRCVDVVSKAVAILPWGVFEKSKAARRERPDHPVHWILHNQPNPEMQPYQFKHWMVSQLETWGNAYCEIQRDGQGRPLALWPITADRVTPRRSGSGEIEYEVTQSGNSPARIPASDVLHIRGFGFDGLIGYSPIRMAANSIGLGQAMEQFGASFFKNGANMGGTLEHPQKLSPPSRKNLEDSLQRNYSGAKAHRWLVLEEGMKAVRQSVPPNEAQFLESRKFQVEEICRWFGVPPHKVGALDRATWNNIEHQALEFVTDTIQPIVTQIEEEVNVKLFGRVNRGVLYSKFNMAALLRGDSKSRWEVYEIAHRNGLLSADEIRTFEEMNPIPKGLGKIYVMQGQMVTREQVKEGEQIKGASPDPSANDPSSPEEPMSTDPTNRLMNAGRMLNVARKQK